MDDQTTNTETQDDYGWDDAAKTFIEEEGGPINKPESEEIEEEEETEEQDEESEETSEESEQGETEESEEAEEIEEEAPGADDPIRQQRAIQKELAADLEATKADIKEKMFPDVASELTDEDGDPIKTVEDVMKLINSVTGKPFTEDEASKWLTEASQYIHDKWSETENKINAIAEVNLTLKDEATSVRNKYKELFEAMPHLAKETWELYKKTLTFDEKAEVYTEMKVPLEEFYDSHLKGYMVLSDRLKTEQAAKDAAKKKAERGEEQSDRSDIFSGGKTEVMDQDSKEWAQSVADYVNN